MNPLIEHLKRAFDLTEDLVKSLPETSLGMKLKDLPANSIGEQFWCITGARESYLKAIAAGAWAGFGCSLKNASAKSEVLQCLQNSSNEFLSFLRAHELNDTQKEFLLNLLEHEIQHHGQLIRFVYANRLGFPESWNKRYTV